MLPLLKYVINAEFAEHAKEITRWKNSAELSDLSVR